jgi:hypothetical protein
LIGLHSQYNDIVRQVAGELSVPLVDLDREFSALDKGVLFIEDHIHLSQAGRILAGRLIAERIAREGCLDHAGPIADPEALPPRPDPKSKNGDASPQCKS